MSLTDNVSFSEGVAVVRENVSLSERVAVVVEKPKAAAADTTVPESKSEGMEPWEKDAWANVATTKEEHQKDEAAKHATGEMEGWQQEAWSKAAHMQAGKPDDESEEHDKPAALSARSFQEVNKDKQDDNRAVQATEATMKQIAAEGEKALERSVDQFHDNVVELTNFVAADLGQDNESRKQEPDHTTVDAAAALERPQSKGALLLSLDEAVVSAGESVQSHAAHKRAGPKRATRASTPFNEHLHEAAWKQRVMQTALFGHNKTSRSCTLEEEGCRSLCRWLKLSDGDSDESFDGACPLLSWSLEPAGYVARNEREIKEDEPIDCVVDAVAQHVLPQDVEGHVSQLQDCMGKLPQADAEKYGVSLEVLAGQLDAWASEQRLRNETAKAEQTLRRAVQNGRRALSSRKGEQEAVKGLEAAMESAEQLDGHFMAEDVRLGRELLERLQPVVAVKEQIEEGVERAHAALQSKSLEALDHAGVWLNVSIDGAKKLGLEELVEEAKDLRGEVMEVQEVMNKLHSALFQGNVSVNTKLHVGAAMEDLDDAMKRAKATNATTHLHLGDSLLVQLHEVKDAQKAIKEAIYGAQSTLASALDGGREGGLSQFAADIADLNKTLDRAKELGLPQRDTSEAVSMLVRLRESMGAKQALKDAVAKGRNLSQDSLDWATDAKVIGELSEAVTWAEHARLEQGLPTARELLVELTEARELKARMGSALSRGNMSLESKVAEDDTIDEIAIIVRDAHRLNVSAGAAPAKEMLRRLRELRDAHLGLEAAVLDANRTLLALSAVPAETVERLKAGIEDARAQGLDAEADIGRTQLGRLEALRDARDDLDGALHLNVLRADSEANISSDNIEEPDSHGDEDEDLVIPRNRSALKVVDLPSMSSWRDDGDSDFEEHISRLNRSIELAEGMGLMDPEMTDRLKKLRHLQAAWEDLNRTNHEGLQALALRTGLYATGVKLESAVERAKLSGLAVGLSKSRRILREIRELPQAREELDASMVLANVSLTLMAGTHDALQRLNLAIERAQHFGLKGHMDEASCLRDRLRAVNEAWVRLRAASVQGTVSLRKERAEDAAIRALESAVAEAEAQGVRGDVPQAKELLEELQHMNSEQKRVEEAVLTRQQ